MSNFLKLVDYIRELTSQAEEAPDTEYRTGFLDALELAGSYAEEELDA